MTTQARPRIPRLSFLFLALSACLQSSSSTRAEDWAHWRGPEQTGVSRDTNLPDRWSPDPNVPDNNLIWKQPFGGRSTPLVLNNRVYIINNVGEGINEQERVMCFDGDSGKPLWEYRFNVWHTDIVSVRVGWTYLAGDPETGNVLAHGTQGLLLCFDKDGKVLWSRSLTEEFGRVSGYGGRVNSPIVDGNLVIIGMVNASWGDQAVGACRFLAVDKSTGAPVWWAQAPGAPKGTFYSVPVVAVINGERLMITGASTGGVYAFKVRTGELVWSYIFGAAAVNCSPVVDGTRVYIGHGEENLDTSRQGRVICVDASQVKNGKPKLVWEKVGLKIRYCSPIIHAGRLYVCDEIAQMYCLDAATGKQLWKHKYGRNAKGSPVWADDKIYVSEVNARFHILKPGEKSCEELHAQFFPSPEGLTADVELNGSPAVANGRVYFMTRDELFCIGKKDGRAGEAPAAPTPGEEPASPDAKPTHLQVFPTDVSLDPGESVSFTARLFDAEGRFIKETKASWSVGPTTLPSPPPGAKPPVAGAKPPTPPILKGQIGSDGHLTVARDLPGQFGTVVAEADGMKGLARVRVAPPASYKQDFEKVPEGRTPPGWVNCQGKYAVQQKEGSKVLVKLANNANPLLARATTYIGKPGLTNYTIQVDVFGTKKHGDLPDMGAVANRYTLMLDGNKQRLRIVSWDAMPRVDKSIDWAWNPGVWYTLKLSVDVEGNKALVRGKAWPRDQQEPEAWTVELNDPTPNFSGSPGLYGYATGIQETDPGAEIYYDNVVITPNRRAETRK